jgi:hypothetical protein
MEHSLKNEKKNENSCDIFINGCYGRKQCGKRV